MSTRMHPYTTKSVHLHVSILSLTFMVALVSLSVLLEARGVKSSRIGKVLMYSLPKLVAVQL